MKKSIKIIVTVSLLLFMAPLAFGQHCGNTTTRTIELEDSSDNEAIKLEVEGNTECLQIGVNSTIKSGSLTMEIYDPKGDKQGNFSVESQISSNTSSGGKKKELVCGQLNKTIKEPMAGTWTIRLKPKKSDRKDQYPFASGRRQRRSS